MNKEARPVSGLPCVTNVRQQMNNIKHNIPIAIKKTTIIGQVFRPTCLTFIQGKVNTLRTGDADLRF